MTPAPHGSEQVEPAGHVRVPPPLQITEHAVVPPHCTVQPVAPWQSAVQPPCGQSMVQVLFPVQDTVEPVSTFTLHALPPPQVTVLSVPVESMQVLVPSHVVVHPDRQVPWHVDWPAHDVVQPVPHVEVHAFFELQL